MAAMERYGRDLQRFCLHFNLTTLIIVTIETLWKPYYLFCVLLCFPILTTLPSTQPMKYLLTLFAIFLAAITVAAWFLRPEPEKVEEDILVTVNNHVIPQRVLEQKRAQLGGHGKDDKALIDTIIINDLLLQEAQRLGIDKEPNFRLSVQNYYEQSLIKILIDTQFSDMEIEATEEEIDNYIANYGKIFTYTRLNENNGADSSQAPLQKSVLFEDLSDYLKLTLGEMKEGEVAQDFFDGSELVSFRLDKVAPGPVQQSFTGNRQSIKTIISNYKKGRKLAAWIKELRDRATITFPDKVEKP